MKAMVLAAGLGRRLRPLTDELPKALVPIRGIPILEIVIRRLMRAGVDQLIVNTHHLSDQVESFLSQAGFGVPITLSHEDDLLETGGGLKHASWFFDDGRPFFVHNADVLSSIDLERMYRFHEENGALATLAVSQRPSPRRLFFDKNDRLLSSERTKAQSLAFNGIHVVSPRIFPLMSESGAFSITQTYLRLAGVGQAIQAFRTDEYFCTDIGTPDKLEKAQSWAAPRDQKY